MFSFYCNQCFCQRKLNPSLELNVSRCGHILCKNCVQEICCVCSRPFNGIPINNKMPQTMAQYFANPFKQYQNFLKVTKFHYEQEQRLVQHMCESIESEQKKTLQERQKYLQLQEILKMEAHKERQKINKMREYIAFHERRLEQVQYMTPSLRVQPRPRYPAKKNIMEKLAPPSSDSMMIQQLSTNVFYPRSPTVSANNSSITTEGTEPPQPVARKQRTPPPLLPVSQHKLLQQQFSFNSID